MLSLSFGIYVMDQVGLVDGLSYPSRTLGPTLIAGRFAVNAFELI